MSKTETFFTENGPDAQLPPENMAALLLGSDPPAEPEKPAEEPTAPVEIPAEPEKLAEPKVEIPAEPEKPAEKPVILAKDGEHIIKYEKLEEARDKAKAFKEQLDSQTSEIDKLKDTIAQLTTPSEDPADVEAARVAAEEAAEAIEDLKKNDPEVYKAVEVMLNTQLKSLEQKFEDLVKPIQETTELSATDLHFKAIEDAHDDYESLVESGKVDEWIKTQPAITQGALTAILDGGTSKEVVELFTMYKDSQSAPESAVDDAEAAAAKEIADKAAEAVKAAKEKTTVPNSLSDVPAGSKAHHDPNEAMLEKSPKAMIDAFTGKSVSDIMDSMDRIL